MLTEVLYIYSSDLKHNIRGSEIQFVVKKAKFEAFLKNCLRPIWFVKVIKEPIFVNFVMDKIAQIALQIFQGFDIKIPIVWKSDLT